jgi:hypothetical protein
MRNTYAVGPQTVRLTVRDARPLRNGRLLRAGQPLPFSQNGNVIEFNIPQLQEYEVAAFEN